MDFIVPGQVFSWDSIEPGDDYKIFLHPDIFKSHSVSKNTS